MREKEILSLQGKREREKQRLIVVRPPVSADVFQWCIYSVSSIPSECVQRKRLEKPTGQGYDEETLVAIFQVHCLLISILILLSFLNIDRLPIVHTTKSIDKQVKIFLLPLL